MSEEDDYREYERECAREDEHWLDEQIETAVAAEREQCAEICAEVRRTALRQTTGDMAHTNGIAVGAEYCERKIRGQNG